MFKAPRGTADILPADQKYWQLINHTAAETCRRFGYERLDTPVFEDYNLFARSVGEATDIVIKEMYVFEDRSGNRIALRPEGTAPVCRAYLEHGMHNLPQPVKLYYLASIFRYERPQAGRYREHHQFGFEAIGDPDPALDAEVIDLTMHFYRSLGLNNLTLHLNNIGCRTCRPAYLNILKQYYADKLEGLCPDCRNRYQHNPLRLLDCKEPGCQAVATAAPTMLRSLCEDCGNHLRNLQKYLLMLNLSFEFNHRLVRGLDYYTKTVFEVQSAGSGVQAAVGGGGRYDNLIEDLGGKPTPAIGFATGIERIIRNLVENKVEIPPFRRPSAYIAFIGENTRIAALTATQQLRQEGMAVIGSLSNRSLKAQLRHADASGARFVVIFGEDELAKRLVTMRNMTNSEQMTVPLDDLVSRLRSEIHPNPKF